MDTFEKLGAFYLGKVFDVSKKELTEELVLYDSKDLTTHAVCVGMTGSGKTGLCVSILEEAAIDGIPSIIIDPKGDMTNLALNFPDLKADDFKPWIDENEARKKNLSLEEYAAKQAESWGNGLKQWGQGGDRIKKLQESADLCIYTPGSSSGVPVSILKSFAAPPNEILEDTDSFNDRVSSTVTSLLGLIGIDADPIKDREHILLSSILQHFWNKHQDLDLSSLIRAVQEPPITKIGVFDIATFYPQQDRFELAMALNNLLASPAFQSWVSGDALDIGSFLYTNEGKPRISIFYIAHLSDAERMFFISLLLNQIQGWMRTQSGTTSLRALLYFDEIFGYIPPVSNPPTKKPLLTLLKQARAFGLGVVLATQNPVDLDYKGLSNTGTWLIGRLQTERDRDRVLDGLLSASGDSKFNKQDFESIINNLGKRVFLLHNVHEKEPVVFHTRWAMSYLAGPLTRTQIKTLMADKSKRSSIKMSHEEGNAPTSTTTATSHHAPLIPEIVQYYMPIRSARPEGGKLVYRPHLLGALSIRFTDKKNNINHVEQTTLITPIIDQAIPVSWENNVSVDMDLSELLKKPEEEAIYERAPSAALDSKNYKSWEDDLLTHIYRSYKLTLLKSNLLDISSKPHESERDFRARLTLLAREQRDQYMEELRSKYDKKIAAIESKIRKAEERVNREKDQSKNQKLQTAISVGTTILGAFLGRKTLSKTTISKAGTAMRNASRTMKESGDVERAEEELKQYQQELQDIHTAFQEEIDAYNSNMDIQTESFDHVSMLPLKKDIQVELFCFTWVPAWQITGDVLRYA
ncbi:DUF87 domain-containing protein [candidate division KSB1 bacterium]|nr:DUF87 domain-containing protein [candidate division KSB1 bacterium]